jgi:hypothetical protein
VKYKTSFRATVDGVEAEYAVVKPDAKLQSKAQLFKANKVREAAQGGALLREEVDKLLRSRKVWDDQKEQLYEALVKALREDEEALATAKRRGKKLSEARDIALRMAANFTAVKSLQAERSGLDHLTAEGMAAGAEFDYLLAHSVRCGDGKAYYESYEDMADRPECPVYEKAKVAFMDLLYGPYEEQLKRRPEWKFLLANKFVDEKLNLIDKDGHRVDGLGRRVDDKGRLVNAAGEAVDDKGNRLDEDGFLRMEEGEWGPEEEKTGGENTPVASPPPVELEGQVP